LSGGAGSVHRRGVAEPSFAVPASFRPTFTAGGTLSRGIVALLQRPFTYLGLTLAQAIPVVLSFAVLGAVIGPDAMTEARKFGYPGWFWPMYTAACLTSLVPFGASLHAASEQLAGQRVSFSAALAIGFRRFLPLLAVYVLFSLAVAAGTILMFVPGMILSTVYIVSMPVAVQEQRGVFGALGRAARLSKGYRTTLFVIGLAYVGIVIAVYIVSVLVILGLSAMTGVGGVAGAIVSGVLLFIAVITLYGGIMALFPVLLAATYTGLCEEKEGGRAGQVAGVFT
jgi:hypothetical protein